MYFQFYFFQLKPTGAGWATGAAGGFATGTVVPEAGGAAGGALAIVIFELVIGSVEFEETWGVSATLVAFVDVKLWFVIYF